MNNRAIFLDRDDTIIVDRGYLSNPNDIEFLPGVVSALKTFQDTGYLLIMVSNQSGIGRGYFTIDEYNAVHARFMELLKDNDISFTAYYYCPHAPDDNCECRKPKAFWAYKAAEEYNIDLNESYMIGDKDSDIEFGNNFGAKQSFKSVTECVQYFERA
ncbi:MAG: HAD family hydrolase [Oscillospiraceae bacterium]|nr:HAD family hydrolase [Oscillospiraceae bacterium]